MLHFSADGASLDSLRLPLKPPHYTLSVESMSTLDRVGFGANFQLLHADAADDGLLNSNLLLLELCLDFLPEGVLPDSLVAATLTAPVAALLQSGHHSLLLTQTTVLLRVANTVIEDHSFLMLHGVFLLLLLVLLPLLVVLFLLEDEDTLDLLVAAQSLALGADYCILLSTEVVGGFEGKRAHPLLQLIVAVFLIAEEAVH